MPASSALLEQPVPPAFLAAAKLLRARTLEHDWRREARPEQLPPEGDWFIWLVCAGRGWGKTWLGARWLAEQATSTPGDYGVVGRSEQDTRDTCIEGRSGLLAALGLHLGSPEYRRGTQQIRLPNGSVIYAYSAESPERTRGPNLSGVWCDELAAWRFLAQMWDETLIPAVRIGDPQIVVTTTPRPVPLLRELVSRDDGTVVVTRGSTFDNAANLSAGALAELRRRYDGTRIGRQELLGELLDDVDGALWNRELIEPHRVASIDRGELVRVVVAVDPAVTASKHSDQTGIIVAGADGDGQGYVLDDLTCKLAPDGWARRVLHAYRKWGAGRVVAEANQGGRLVETVLRTVETSLPITLVHASHGKQIRAEPIAAVYEQGKVHHVGAFPELEDELCTWIPGQASSPDRLDALVWAFTELKPGRVHAARPRRIPRLSPSPLSAVANQSGFGMGPLPG
jgi:phage terminase large subunit-like protein